MIDLGGPAVGADNRPITRTSRAAFRWNVIVIRMLDAVVAATLLIVLIPLIIALAIAIKLESRGPVAIENARDDARVNPRARELMGIRGVAYLPLLSGNQSFGLLILITGRPHAWTPRELELARRFADVASVALENSRLMTQLAETEVRFRSLVEHVPVIIYRCDVAPPYWTRYISPQVTVMLGYSADEWTRDQDFWMKIVHPDDVGSVIDLDQEAIRNRGFASSEYRLLDRSGETRWFRDEAILVRDPSGTPIAWHGVLVEITGIKKLEH